MPLTQLPSAALLALCCEEPELLSGAVAVVACGQVQLDRIPSPNGCGAVRGEGPPTTLWQAG